MRGDELDIYVIAQNAIKLSFQCVALSICPVGVQRRWQSVEASLMKEGLRRKVKVISAEVLCETD